MLISAYKKQIECLENCETPYTNDYKIRVKDLKLSLSKLEKIN